MVPRYKGYSSQSVAYFLYSILISVPIPLAEIIIERFCTRDMLCHHMSATVGHSLPNEKTPLQNGIYFPIADKQSVCITRNDQ